jgi:hypothetical protein
MLAPCFLLLFLFVIPGRIEDANPESRDSPMRNAHLRSGPSDHPE